MNELITQLLDNQMVIAASFGILGAFIRVLSDIIRFSIARTKKQRLETEGVIFYFISIILIGAFMGVVLDYGWALSVLGGYAGQDILDVLYKSMNKVNVSKSKS